jgi:predicted permease
MSAWEAAGTVLISAAQTFGVVALGYIYGRLKGPGAKELTEVTMAVFVPALALTAILDAEIDPRVFGKAATAALMIIGLSAAGAWLGLRALGWKQRRGILLTVAIVNSANIPFPLISANFGPEGLSLAVLCYVVTNIVVFTVGIGWMSGTANPKALVREPAFIATAGAVIMKFANIGLPPGVNEMAHLAAEGAIPAMLVLLGQTLAGVRMREVRSSLVAVLFRYVFGFIGGVVAVTVLGLTGLLRDIVLFYSLLPSAVATSVIAKRYERDSELVATTVLLTTIVAVVVLPLVLVAIKTGVPARIWP